MLKRFMSGRNGPDKLGAAIICLSMLLFLFSGILPILSGAAYIAAVFALFRFLSRNIPARRRENDRFVSLWWPIRTKLLRFFKNTKNRK